MRNYKPRPKRSLMFPEDDPNANRPKVKHRRWHIPKNKPKKKMPIEKRPFIKTIHHPGIDLLNHYINYYGLTMHKLSYRIGVPSSRIASIVYGQRSITVDTAVRLGIFYGISPHQWLDEQAIYDIDQAWKLNKWQYDQIVPLKKEEWPVENQAP